MTGINVILLLIYSFFIQYSASIDLILPLSESDAEHFEVRQRFLLDWIPNDSYIFNFISYESLTSDIIRKVVFHGVELFNDTSEHGPEFERFVVYGTSSDRVLIGVTNKVAGTVTNEGVFAFTRNMITNFMESGSVELFIRDHPSTILAEFLSSITNPDQHTNAINNDEMDSVDDQPYLVRGRTNISSEEIEKEVDSIMRTNSSTPNDREVEGPSGITEHSNLRKKEEKDQTQGDSDSD